jgi:hypothetical protein
MKSLTDWRVWVVNWVVNICQRSLSGRSIGPSTAMIGPPRGAAGSVAFARCGLSFGLVTGDRAAIKTTTPIAAAIMAPLSQRSGAA